MTAYAWVEISVNDVEGMGPYREKVKDTVAAHGGKYLILGGDTEVLEGNIGQHPSKVLLEFPTMEAARGWYHSAEYQEILPARLKSSTANFVLVEGV